MTIIEFATSKDRKPTFSETTEIKVNIQVLENDVYC